MTDLDLINMRRKLRRHSDVFVIQHTNIGFWVEGVAGYHVVDPIQYFDTEKEALEATFKSIDQLKDKKTCPSWCPFEVWDKFTE